MFVLSLTNVFDDATFWEILLSSLSYVNDYFVCVYKEYVDLDGNNIEERVDLIEKKLHNATN